MIGCVVGQGLIAKFLIWLARMLRELSRLGSKRMPPVEAEAEDESRPSSPKKSGLSGRMEESGANDGADDVKEMKNFDLSRLVLISAWKKGTYTALPGVLVITFLAFPVVSALVRRLGSNPRGTSRPSQRHAPRLLTTEPPPPRLSPRASRRPSRASTAKNSRTPRASSGATSSLTTPSTVTTTSSMAPSFASPGLRSFYTQWASRQCQPSAPSAPSARRPAASPPACPAATPSHATPPRPTVPCNPTPSARQVLAAAALSQRRDQDRPGNPTERGTRVSAPGLRGELLCMGDLRAGSPKLKLQTQPQCSNPNLTP